MESDRLSLRAAVAGCFSLGTSLSFFLLGVLPVPVPLYFPLARRFGLSQGAPGEISMDWYGRTLYAWLGGAAFALVCYAILRRLRPTARGLLLLTAYTATALVLCGGLYAYKLMTRNL